MTKLITVIVVGMVVLAPRVGYSCGGFFCQFVPIDQAAEQIVFSQQGNQISALVRIEYVGEAEDFSWVVPVPPSIELEGGVDVGSDTTIAQLDQATQPQFVLEQTGSQCESDFLDSIDGSSDGISPEADNDSSEEVGVEETTVGPFDVQLITSDNPDAMANWLVENDYDLSDRGRELIEPYVLDGMKFVGLKLQSGQSSGSIQPVILRYRSEKPMIPIRLTAVAAEDDMGVLVWVVGPSRAVPDNYKHVIPNYTRLNWFAGSRNAYGSYQDLITEAMNDAENGQGFATDMATVLDSSILDFMTDGAALQAQFDTLDMTTTDAGFIAGVAGLGSSTAFQAELQAVLPLLEGQGSFIYFDTGLLLETYNTATLAAARSSLRESFQRIEIDPVTASMALLPTGRFITRLYTTLSADEMTLDPTFDYNNQMGDQPRERRALLTLSCGDNGSEWTLTLGAGTGREGEVVIEATGAPPFGPLPIEIDGQAASFRIESTSAAALPDLVAQNDFSVLEINGGITDAADNGPSDGGGDGQTDNGSSDGGEGGSMDGGSIDGGTEDSTGSESSDNDSDGPENSGTASTGSDGSIDTAANDGGSGLLNGPLFWLLAVAGLFGRRRIS